MFEYSICNQPDHKIFQLQCVALEKHIPGIAKGELLNDVDGSQTQLYTVDQKRISVHNSYYIGSVFVESEIELEQYFTITA